MKAVCRKRCQVRLATGKIRFFMKGEVGEFEKCPKYFDSLEGENIVVDFSKASREELMLAKWKFADAQIALKELFDYDLVKEEGVKKSDIVERILDLRFRLVTDADRKGII